MAPCRQLLLWSVPSIAVLLGIFWFRKKREYAKSNPGGRAKIKNLHDELAEALNSNLKNKLNTELEKAKTAIIKSSAPINIVPVSNGSLKASPLELTDEEIDLEIEKIIRKKSLDKEKKMPFMENCSGTINISSCPSSVVSKPLLNNYSSSITDGVFNSKNVNISQVADTKTPDTSPIRERNIDHNCSSEKICNSQCYDKQELKNSENVNDKDNVKLENSNNNVYPHTNQERHHSERDSANHSPVDQMLASPSIFSDNHSEGSSDSGKGCSEAASPPPVNINMVPSEMGLRIHQFLIPQTLVGLLIGKQGSFVIQIKAKTGASVYVRAHPDSVTQKICAVEGTQSEIEAALEMIKEKFPEKRFPNFSLQEISADLYQKLVPFVPDYIQLQLVESVNNDTIMTCLVSAGHFFLQQPLHPTFPSLHALHRLMAATYQDPDVPALPRPIADGTICAAPTENNWYRAQVISTSEENDTSVVKLVDFGGYLTVDNDQLKQIRSDFMTLPFQATEALLAFVKPPNNESEWSGEALRIMAGLTAGQLLHAQVAGYDEAGLPLVHLYLTLSPQQVIYLNRELVERELAEWDVPPDS